MTDGASNGVKPANRHGSALATAVGTASLAAAASALPVTFARSPRNMLSTAFACGLVGAGIGAAMHPLIVRGMGGNDAVNGGLTAVGAGGAVYGLSRIGTPGSTRAIVGSLGLITAAAGASVLAGTLPLGGLAAGGLGAVALGGFAVTGRLGGAVAPSAVARSAVRVSRDMAEGWTGTTARSNYQARITSAKNEYLSLPNTSNATWAKLGTGKTFLTGVATPAQIAESMGRPAVATPRRIFVGVDEAPTPEGRVSLALERMKAAGVATVGTIHVHTPTADGALNNITPLTVEHGTLGDVVTVVIQTTAVEPHLAAHKVGMAARTQRMLLEGIAEINAARPADDKARVLHSAYCYGGWVSHRAFLVDGTQSLADAGIAAAHYEGSPGFSRHARKFAGQVERGEEDGRIFHTRAEVEAATAAGETPNMVTLMHHRDDPMRVGLINVVMPLTPADVGPQTPYIPFVSALATFLSTPAQKPRSTGEFLEAGHQFRAGGSSSVNFAFGLGMTPEQIAKVDQYAVLDDYLRGLASPSSPRPIDPV